MDSRKILSSDILDIVFEGRNKDYGAYQLRRKYVRTMALAFLITMLLFAFGFSSPYVVEFFKKSDDEVVTKKTSKAVTMEEPPPLDEKKPEPELPPPPPVEQVKFVAPEITKEEVKEEEQLIENKEIKPNVVIGAENVEGDSNALPNLNTENQVIGGEGESDKPLLYAEEQPEFPGGPAALMAWLREHVQYPKAAKDNGLEGKVTVRFVVNGEGRIDKIEILKPVPGLDEEAVRVMEEMRDKVKWKPGRQNGKPVSVYYTLPIKFVLD